MNRIITYLLAFACSAVAAEETDTSPVFKSSDTQSITAKVGQKITIKGTVSTVRKSNGGTNFINFEDSEFYLVAFKSDLKAFKTESLPISTKANILQLQEWPRSIKVNPK